MCKEDRCVGLGQKRLHKGGGNCLKNLKRGWNRKEGKENKDFKKKGGGAQTGLGCLRAGTTLRTMRNLEEILRIFVFRPYKKGKVFHTSVDLEGTPNPIPDRFFLCIYL